MAEWPIGAFTLYSRSYCHLCEDMLLELQHMLQVKQLKLDIQVVDVDADEALLEKYDELVPVLIGRDQSGNSHELCHYHLDHTRVNTYLAALEA